MEKTKTFLLNFVMFNFFFIINLAQKNTKECQMFSAVAYFFCNLRQSEIFSFTNELCS